ncbi:MAG: segregation/condensation protein A [Planctomycetes bacterium]|jgi:segregation and condensation protein A|nr:segregation/condensation protein A [Planctomycetota bacterium]
MLEISTEKFSGPLGLLLSLIEEEKLDITEIGLAKIADQYIEYLKESTEIDADEMADFVLIASKLLYLKSKALLPYLILEEEEEGIDDLEKQLKIYKEFLVACEKIEALIKEERFAYFKKPETQKKGPLFPDLGFFPPRDLKAQTLQGCFQEILSKLKPKEEKLKEEKLEPKISIEERISSIRDHLFQKIRLNFSHILKQAQNKTEMIVSFLAVLELAKQRELFFEQGELFGEIMLVKSESDLTISSSTEEIIITSEEVEA